MYRVLFHWRGIKIHSYPALLYLGLLLGIISGNYAANRAGLPTARIFVATFVLLVPTLIGARLLFVAAHWNIYRREPCRIWRRSEGGGSLYGGFLLTFLASIPLLSWLKVGFGSFWDVATFTMLVGMIFTRCGCLLNGCCAGRVSGGRFTIQLPNHLGRWQRRFPTQLIEALWATWLLVGAVVFWRVMPFRGALFLVCLAGYAVGRFLLEPTREEQERIGKLSIHKAISAALFLTALTGLLVVCFR